MRILLFLLCLISQKLSWAQCSFSFAQDVCEEIDYTSAAIQLWDGDFIVGGAGPGCDGNPDLTVLTRFDCSGNIVWQKSYPENDAFGLPTTMSQIDSNTILVASGPTLPRIFKVNIHTGQLLQDMFNFIPHPIKFDFYSAGNALVIDKNFYTTATYYYPNAGNRFYILKTELETFKIIWFKEIIVPNVPNSEQLIVSYPLMGSSRHMYLIITNQNRKNTALIAIDTSGTVLSLKHPFDSLQNPADRPWVLGSPSLSIDQSKILSVVTIDKNSDITHLCVLDTNGTISKFHKYEEKAMYRFIQTRDGNYAICGELDLIRKLDTNFQTIYSIKSPWKNSFYQVIGEASDGGLFVGGLANGLGKRGDMAFIKAEPHGGINSVQEVQDLAAQIQTSPNPATTQVHITSPVKLESYTINNTSGTQLQSGVLENDNNIDISQLPQGLYFLQVQLENGQMVTKKLVRN
jgi:hypothetical protein